MSAETEHELSALKNLAWCQSLPGKALRVGDTTRASGIPAAGFTKGNHPRTKSVIRREAYLGSTIGRPGSEIRWFLDIHCNIRRCAPHLGNCQFDRSLARL